MQPGKTRLFFESAAMLKYGSISLLLFALAGCDPGRSGIVTETAGPWLKYKEYAPRVYLDMDNGGRARMEKLGSPFFVLAFIAPSGDDPNYVSPALDSLAERFNLNSVAVIQVTEPTAACDLADIQHGAYEPPKPSNLMRFFDPQQKALRAYNASVGDVLVVNRMPSLLAVISLRTTMKQQEDTDFQAVRDRIDQLDQQWRQYEWENGYSYP